MTFGVEKFCVRNCELLPGVRLCEVAWFSGESIIVGIRELGSNSSSAT